jgi:hypothetical protein
MICTTVDVMLTQLLPGTLAAVPEGAPGYMGPEHQTGVISTPHKRLENGHLVTGSRHAS